MNKGYSLFSLIIGIFLIGALAVIAVILVNPGELALQSRDASRKKEVVKLGESLISYSRSRNGVIPQNTKSWLSELHARGEIAQIPSPIAYDDTAALCKVNEQSGFCYDTDSKTPSNSAIVYTKLESVSENTKCNVSLSETAWYVYDMLSVRGGIVCTVGVEPSFNQDGQNFKD